MMIKMAEGLRQYCEQTSLHGWYYISGSSKSYWKVVWSAIVLTSIGVASLFIYKAAEEFTKSTVVTTIHSTTEPLSEVFFPAVTVCNINQVGVPLIHSTVIWDVNGKDANAVVIE